jgi:glutaredoxin
VHELTVYGAPDCCLCDDAKAALDRLAPELGLVVTHIDISGDSELEAAHRTEIPVGFMDGRKVFKYRVDESLLRRRAATQLQ